jgi:hypothetical protein
LVFAEQRSTAQRGHDRADVIFLEKPDGGDAGCACSQTRFRILQSYSSERQHGNSGVASLGESFEALRDGSGSVFFFEDGSEHGKGGSVC